MSSELELSKQRITELEAENVNLRRKLSVSDAEIAELKRRNIEFLRANKEYNERRDAENAKLKARIEELEKNSADTSAENAELRDRVTKVEQRQMLNDNTPNDNTPNNNSSNFNSGAVHHEKSSQEKEMDIFLDEEDKKIVGEDITRRNKEKKLQRESAGQDSSSDTAYVSGTVNNIEKTDVPKITNCTSSELSHETEVIEDIANSAVDSNTINDRSASEEIGKTVSLGYDRVASDSLEEIESKVDQVPLGSHQDKSVAGPDIVTEFVQGLLEELLSDNDQLQTIKFSSPRTIVPGSISIKRLANSFCQANCARNRSITAKRAEITAWRLFSERFENKVLELRSENKKLADRTARTQIYAEMKPYLTGISDEYLRVRTSRARKINKLFGFEYDPVTLKKIDGIPGYMVNRVTCSADRISKLTNPQIEYIIEQVKSKTIADQSRENEISETMANTSTHDSDDNFSDTSDVTDYFKEEEEETNVVTSTPAKTDDDVYFEESEEETNEEVVSQSVKTDDDSNCNRNSDSEEEMPDDSDDDGYGGYNEYGERDRGCYYRDGRYERKVSPMMSPIISPVTA
jgi:hypothetical protein